MKKTIVAIAGLACLLASANDASAYVKKAKTKTRSSSTTVSSSQSVSGNIYVSGGGIYAPEVSFNSGFSLGSAYGLRLAAGTTLGNFRVEGEVTYTTGAGYTEEEVGWWHEEVSYSQISVMANGYYDIPLNGSFELFVNAGMGVFVDMVAETYEDSHFGYDEFNRNRLLLGCQIGGGVSYNIKPSISVDFGYRFSGMFNENDLLVVNKIFHELLLGARYKF